MGWKNKEDERKWARNYVKKYRQLNPHQGKIQEWKRRGVKLKPNEDWISVYLFYKTCENCELCNVKLTDEKKNSSTRRCLDHDHSNGFIRNILCIPCNRKIN